MGRVAVTARSRTIAAQPDRVWAVLEDFGALSSWADGIAHSCLLNQGESVVGTSRRVQVGREALVETITDCEPPRLLAYDVAGLPKALRHVANRWTLDPLGASTRVTVTSTVEVAAGVVSTPAEWLVVRVMARTSNGMLTDLARRLEGRHD